MPLRLVPVRPAVGATHILAAWHLEVLLSSFVVPHGLLGFVPRAGSGSGCVSHVISSLLSNVLPPVYILLLLYLTSDHNFTPW